MKKFTLYRQNTVIAVTYAEDISEAADDLMREVRDDLSEKYGKGYTVTVTSPEYTRSRRYRYKMLGIVSPYSVPKNIVVRYDVRETANGRE